YGALLYLYSFPTRRSSDLPGVDQRVFLAWTARMLVGCHYSRRVSSGCSVVLVDEAAEPVAAPDLADRRRFWPLRFRGLQLERTRSEEHTSELQSRGHLVCR